MNAPQCEERCEHGQRLPYCDHCASVPRMSRWAATLTDYQLADALETIGREPRVYTSAERLAILIEAARRVRP